MIYTITLSPALDRTLYLNNFEIDGINAVDKSYIEAGGKGINSAKILNLLGSDVTSIAFLGGDTGEKINKILENSKIKQKNIYLGSETRTNIKLLDLENKICTELNEKANLLKKEDIEAFDVIFDDILLDAKFITFGGRLCENLPLDFYGKYINIAKNKNVKVLLDTSGKSLQFGIEEKPWCIKPNYTEFCEYFGVNSLSEEEIIDKCKWLNDKGVEVVIITLGKDGLICSSNKKIYRVRVPKVNYYSTVGAGDTFIGGFLHMLEKTDNMEEALIFGSAMSIIKITNEDLILKNIENVDRYIDKIEIEIYNN